MRCVTPQASAYEVCDRMHMPLDTPKTLETWGKKARLFSFKKLQGVRQIARLKQQRFLSFTFYITQRSYEKIMCIYFLFHWFSGENCIIFLFSLHKERQTSKELKRNMNDGTIIFTYRLNLKNSSSLFFLIQDNFMF